MEAKINGIRIGPLLIQIIYELSEKSLTFSGFSIRFAWNPNENRSLHAGYSSYRQMKDRLKSEK